MIESLTSDVLKHLALKTMAESAAIKIETGALMSIAEVAAKLGMSESAVHALPLKSIRIGRNLRFDPADVVDLINKSKEAV